MADVLSQAEIDALLGQLSSGDLDLDKMQDQMSAADLAYYIDWNARMQKKILEISNLY